MLTKCGDDTAVAGVPQCLVGDTTDVDVPWAFVMEVVNLHKTDTVARTLGRALRFYSCTRLSAARPAPSPPLSKATLPLRQHGECDVMWGRGAGRSHGVQARGTGPGKGGRPH